MTPEPSDAEAPEEGPVEFVPPEPRLSAGPVLPSNVRAGVSVVHPFPIDLQALAEGIRLGDRLDTLV